MESVSWRPLVWGGERFPACESTERITDPLIEPGITPITEPGRMNPITRWAPLNQHKMEKEYEEIQRNPL